MALLFNPNIKQSFVSNVLTGASGSGRVFSDGLTAAVISSYAVYSGAQASASELMANWQTINNTQRLAYYTGTANVPQFLRTGTSFQITVFPTAIPLATGTGTASWAVIFYYGNAASLASMSAATPPSTLAQFLIVPVTLTSGNGVFRYTSLSFTSGQTCPALADGAVSFF